MSEQLKQENNQHLKKETLVKAEKIKEPKTKNGRSFGAKLLELMQGLGKALQFPIAVLPFAAILNRFGTLGISYTTETVDGTMHITNQVGYYISFIIQKPGAIAFDNLPLFFAIGCAFGLANENRGEVTLASVALYFAINGLTTTPNSIPEMFYKNVLTFSTQDGTTYSSLLYVPLYDTADGVTKVGGLYVFNLGVFGGIFSGCMAAYFYNHFRDIKLPQALGFFAGRRFVPMICIAASIPLALLFAAVWPWIQWALMKFGEWLSTGGDAVRITGAGIWGFLNRVILPFGLHQILNTFFYFQMPVKGDIIAPITGDVLNTGVVDLGDINAFVSGNFGSGLTTSGWFPVMMGGLPGAAIAMIFAAKKENRKQVGAFLIGAAAVSFTTGITEPIEFTFVFLSPLLWIGHAVLSAIFMAITTAMHIQSSYGFSAGIIDWAISIPQSWGFSVHQGVVNGAAYQVLGNTLWILPLSMIAAACYYFWFIFAIKKFNIPTPGREDDYQAATIAKDANYTKDTKNKKDITNKNTGSNKYEKMADEIIAATGEDNIVFLDNCTTRLRFTLKDNSIVDQDRIKKSGVYGVKVIGKDLMQVTVGLDVEFVADIIREKTKKARKAA
ncbi:PTS transporter subunit EIIC [Spiroplasma endosymbiont of Labia minor]|uniref:PTS transporter subunit EIIC n=1 Tax=Spiroplasma endosymbiont of Labia minor TaxID=3066305 RepID=UPI0030CBEA6F